MNPYRIRDSLCLRCGHRESSHSTPANDREYRKTATVRCEVYTDAEKKCQCSEFVLPEGEAA